MKILATIFLTICALSSASAQTFVNATSTLTSLGSFAAGTYVITSSGTVDLVGTTAFTMNPDGTPTTTVNMPGYEYFNPSGSFIADGLFGQAGTNAKIGALVGTFSSNPLQASDWFLIGYSTQVTLLTDGFIYASVNETYRVNDSGAFSVSVTAVPEPETYALMLAGLGLMGAIVRRRKATQI